jgi:lactoylglutathione lyase
MFQKVDCIRVHVTDVPSAIDFYERKLGLDLVWKRGNSEAGLKMQGSDTELVLVSEEIDYPEVDILVESVETDAKRFEEEGGRIVLPPFDIQIGKCAVVEDPWKNKFVILDTSRGLLKPDSSKNVS